METAGTSSIRRASLHDLPALAALLETYFTEQSIALRDSAERLHRELMAPELGFFIAQDEHGVLLGCVLGHPLPGMSLDGNARAAECKRLFIRPAARRQGLANLLLDRLELEAAQAGYSWLYLDSLDAFTAALRLYERRGFDLCERYPGSDPQATRFLRKRLGAVTPANP